MSQVVHNIPCTHTQETSILYPGCMLLYSVRIEIDKDQQATMEEENTQAVVAMKLCNKLKIKDKHNQLYNSQVAQQM